MFYIVCASPQGQQFCYILGFKPLAEIFRSDGCVVKVFSNDHQPAHVHVSSAEQEIKIDISGDTAVVLAFGKRQRQSADAKFTKQALRLVNNQLTEVKAAWKSIHNG